MIRTVIIFFTMLIILLSCSPGDPPTTYTIVDVTLNNIPLAHPGDTLNVTLSYFKAPGPWGNLIKSRHSQFVGTLNNHYTDTIFPLNQFDSGKFQWRLRNTAPVDSGFETFPIVPNTTKYILLNY